MSKLLSIFLLVLLPFQFSWAVASQYCTHHEQGQAAQHFGHHADKHHASDVHQQTHQTQTVNDDPSDSSHHHMHHGVSIGLISFWSLPTYEFAINNLSGPDPIYPPPLPLARIERPQWLFLA